MLKYILFFSTLSSFYYYPLGIPYSFLVTNFLVYTVFLLRKQKINIKKIIEILIFNIIFMLSFFITENQPTFRNIFPIILGGITYCCLKSQKIKKIEIECALKLSLLTHIIFFYMQFFSYYIFTKKIDFVKYYSGLEARGLNTTIFRSGGLFHEPGTYGMIVLGLIILWDNYDIKRNIVYYFSFFSLFLCFSSKIIILSLLYIAYLEVLEKKNIKKRILAVIILYVSFMKFKFYIFRKIYVNGHLAENFQLTKFFKELTLSRVLKGSGYGINDYDIILENGLLFTLFTQLGVLGIALFGYILIVFFSRARFKEKIIFMIFSLTKINLNFAFFWVFISLIRSKKDEKK